MAEETEKIYVIPLKKHNYQSSKAAPTAMKRVKEYLKKHMKVDMDNIWIDASLNQEIWRYGKYNMPNKLRVKAVKFDDGVVEAYLPELEFVKSRREIIQEEKAKKAPILLKEEEAEDELMEPEGEDYDVVPTADGDVKIKKKKHEKEESEEESSDEESEKKPKKPVPVKKEESKGSSEEKKEDKKPSPKKKATSSSEKKETPKAKKEEKPAKKAASETKKEKPTSEKKQSEKKTETAKEKKAEDTKKESD